MRTDDRREKGEGEHQGSAPTATYQDAYLQLQQASFGGPLLHVCTVLALRALLLCCTTSQKPSTLQAALTCIFRFFLVLETSFTTREFSLGCTFDTPDGGSSQYVPLPDALKRKGVPRLHGCMQTHVSHSVDAPSHYVLLSSLFKPVIVFF
jgi:hypothetical protein